MTRGEVIKIDQQNLTPKARRNLVATNRSMKLLNPQAPEELEEVETRLRVKHPRMKYATMRARQEMAAQVLAVGGNQKLAANYAGCSERQIKKYYTDPDFRARIEELRAVLASKLKGRIMRELDRRTRGEAIKNMEILDLMRIFDRITVGGKGMAINVGEVNVNNNYESILAALFTPNPGQDGGDFPVYESDSFRLPSGDSPVD